MVFVGVAGEKNHDDLPSKRGLRTELNFSGECENVDSRPYAILRRCRGTGLAYPESLDQMCINSAPHLASRKPNPPAHCMNTRSQESSTVTTWQAFCAYLEHDSFSIGALTN